MNTLSVYDTFGKDALFGKDFMPKLYKEFVGFERLFDSLFSNSPLNPINYPPYNLEKVSENTYRISVAVAGFSKDELDIHEEDEKLLVIKGSKKKQEGDASYLFRGIAQRDFTLRYQLADDVKILDASVVDGMLVINLEKEVKSPSITKIEIK